MVSCELFVVYGLHKPVLQSGQMRRGRGEFMADFFWRLFEGTGSVTAYLLYRQFTLQ